MDEQINRVFDFIDSYIETEEGDKLERKAEVAMACIAVLMSECGMTADEIKREALRDYNVIIPYNYFPEVENGH